MRQCFGGIVLSVKAVLAQYINGQTYVLTPIDLSKQQLQGIVELSDISTISLNHCLALTENRLSPP